MHKTSLAMIVGTALFVFTFAEVGHSLEFFVATDGNDQNPGTREKPYASLTAARDALREIRSAGNFPEQGATVTLRGGKYQLAEPFVLERQDTGTDNGPIVYRAADGEEVELLGSRPITGFQPVANAEILERLDPAARDKIVVADLRANGVEDFGEVATQGKRIEVFFNDKPMLLARWPNEGFAKIVEVVGKTPKKIHGIPGTKEGDFTYNDDRPARWSGEPDVWLHGYWFWDWSDSFERISEIDTAAKIIRLTPPYHGYGYRKNQRYYALNLLCELDQPGEWYVDRKAGLLYFWPPAPIEDNAVTVSVLPQLLSIDDCQSVVFQGIIFSGTRATAIRILNSQACIIENCTVRNTGSRGIVIRGGKLCKVRHSNLYNLGEGGISLGGGDRKTLEPSGHECVSNHIHHFGRLYRTYRPAVSVSGVGQLVAHNLLHDGPHNAIQLVGNEHRIEFNEIHNVCFETGDVGAFYMGRDWTARGTVIRHNYFHDIRGPGLHGAMAVYLDDAASGIKIIGNVFNRAGRAAFIGGGRDNLVENNIFVDCKPSVHVDARGIGWMHETIKGTLPERLNKMPYLDSPWKERYPQLLTLLDDEPGKPKYNVVRQNISWGGNWLSLQAEAKPLVTFEHNLIDQDPHFVGDPRSPTSTILDFRLRPDSPALEQGFQQIPVEKIGLLK
ncbi:MAG: right-handed parallel beta-helix repeat-containing protein [Planctomycetes bacterium]|nr:right-handed parallel beta-helix repeat-containing protein [Planctomycetota bacterium]